MKRNVHALFGSALLLCASWVSADNLKPQLLTARDVVNNTYSNISIQNKTGAAITVYGVYVNQFASTNGDCTSPTVLYSGTPAHAAGAFVTPMPLNTNQSVLIGQNYLYNMLYTAIYYGNQPSTTLPCMLPGCSWSGDASPADQWCIYLGVMSPSTDTTAAASVPPYANLMTGEGYNYDLVTHYSYIGPITCNDQTLTCSVATAQNVPFPQ